MPAALVCRRLCAVVEDLLKRAKQLEDHTRQLLTSRHPDPTLARQYSDDLTAMVRQLLALASTLARIDVIAAAEVAGLAYTLYTLARQLEQKAANTTQGRRNTTRHDTGDMVEA